MAVKSPAVSSTVSATLISLVVGGVLGFYVQTFVVSHTPAGAASTQGTGASGGPGGGGPDGRGGFGGGGFGGAPSPISDLARLVRNLDTLQKVQGTGFTPGQGASLGPILSKVQSTPAFTDADAQAETDAIQQVLTPAQKDALTIIQPQRGGRGGGGFGGGGGGMATQGPPNEPFISDRNKAALQDLISLTTKR